MKKINWNEIDEAQEFANLTAGGYVCKVIKVEDVPEKEYLLVYCDVAEGEFKDIGWNAETSSGKDWKYIKMYRSYKEKAYGFFKGFLSALEKSNPKRFAANTFDGNEHKMVGLLIGLVLGEEEYQGLDGTTKIRTYVKSLTTPEKIRQGDYKVPPLKVLQGASMANPAEAVSDDCPF